MVTPEQRSEYNRRYHEAHRDEIRERQRRNYHENGLAERQRSRRAADPNTSARDRQNNAKRRLKAQAYREELLRRFLAEQGGGCAICGGQSENWHMDHDASCCKSGVPFYRCGQCERGALCGPCNMSLGLLKEDPARMRVAAQYIERWHHERPRVVVDRGR